MAMIEELSADAVVKIIPELRLYAFFLCKSRSRADDLVQDALERVWRNRGSFRLDGSLKAWMFGILRNRFLDDMRRPRLMVEDVNGDFAAQMISPANQHWRVQYTDLMEAIGALSRESRDALLLVVGAGLSHEEAAQILECPLGTLKSRIRRAREQLWGIVELERPCEQKGGRSQPGV